MRPATLSLLLACLCACGRLGFGGADAAADAKPPQVDAAPVACAVEGAPCEDLDICTASSSCIAGHCAGPPMPPCVAASFADDFSLVQGKASWYYGAWNLSTDVNEVYDPDVDFEMFAPFSGELWRPTTWQETGDNFTWAYIAAWGGHPGSFPEQRYPTRRWVSDVVGHATVILHLAKSDVGDGDGTAAIVYVDGVHTFERSVEYNDSEGFLEEIPIELALGTRVDVMMSFRGADGADSSTLTVSIRSR